MIKYVSIDRNTDKLPDPNVDIYVATEKIDGANFQIAVNLDTQEVSYFKRNSEAVMDENFYNFQEVVQSEEIVSFVEKAKEFFKDSGLKSVHFFGELFGGGIQNRIKYFEGNKRNIIFFDMVTVDENQKYDYAPFMTLRGFFKSIGYSHLLVPIVKIGTWQEMMDIDIENLKSEISYCGDYAEGVVIKPYIDNVYDENNKPVYLKRKSNRFEETKPRKKVGEREIHPLEEIFLSYINENRMLSYFSKEGPIAYMNQLSMYIKGIVEDAWSDFLKDYPDYYDERKKIIGKGGGEIAKLLKTYLEG